MYSSQDIDLLLWNSFMGKAKQNDSGKKLQGAYNEESYNKAKKSLEAIKEELMPINESVARRLEECLEELSSYIARNVQRIKKEFYYDKQVESVTSLVS